MDEGNMENQLPYHLRNADKRGICRQCGAVVYHIKADGYMNEGWFAVEREEPNSICPKATIGHKHWAAKRTVQIIERREQWQEKSATAKT